MEKQDIIISVIDYSTSPGPRYNNQGDHSGEDFYHEVLNQALYNACIKDVTLIVNLDGPDGYASSFLDEAFGNMVYDFTLANVKKHVEIVSKEEPEWIEMLKDETYKEWEKRRIDGKSPTKTTTHKAWWRFDIKNNQWQEISENL